MNKITMAHFSKETTQTRLAKAIEAVGTSPSCADLNGEVVLHLGDHTFTFRPPKKKKKGEKKEEE